MQVTGDTDDAEIGVIKFGQLQLKTLKAQEHCPFTLLNTRFKRFIIASYTNPSKKNPTDPLLPAGPRARKTWPDSYHWYDGFLLSYREVPRLSDVITQFEFSWQPFLSYCSIMSLLIRGWETSKMQLAFSYSHRNCKWFLSQSSIRNNNTKWNFL